MTVTQVEGIETQVLDKKEIDPREEHWTQYFLPDFTEKNKAIAEGKISPEDAALESARQFARLKAQLEKAERDRLTGLIKFDRFIEDLIEQIKINERLGFNNTLDVGGVLGFFDGDGVKGVNDTLGHAAGNKAILRLAKAITSSVRAGDLICRYGGDEFVGYFPGATLEEGVAITQRINTSLKQDSEICKLSLSTGLVAYQRGTTAENLLEEGDKTMYDGKALGKDCVVVYTTHLPHFQAVQAFLTENPTLQKVHLLNEHIKKESQP